MNYLSRLIPILLKSSLLATLIFWLMIAEDFGAFLPFAVILSTIPITLICSFAILVSILPIVEFGGKDSFKKYFPYYSLIVFGTFTYILFESNFEEFLTAFLVSAFFTLMQAWVWVCKSPLNQKKNIKNPKHHD